MPPLNPLFDEAGEQRRITLIKTRSNSSSRPVRQVFREIENHQIRAANGPNPNSRSHSVNNVEVENEMIPKVDHEFDPPSTKKSDTKGLQCLTFIREGDFDIVWLNVFLFTTAHLIHFYALFYVLTHHDTKTRLTWITCKQSQLIKIENLAKV